MSLTSTASSAPAVPSPGAGTVRTLPGLLVTPDEHGGERTWHLAWLRHQCPDCVHPVTGERLVDPSDVDVDVALRAASLVEHGRTLEVAWDDGHTSRYDLAALAELGAPTLDAAPPHGVTLAELEVALDRGPIPTDRVWAGLAQHGAVVLRGLGATTDDTERIVEELGPAGLTLRTSHYGRIEDLRTDNTTNANTDQLGYTDAPVDLHTDLPFVEDPPRFQALHAIRAADRGGDSVVADGLGAASLLRAIDRPAYERLIRTPVRLHRQQSSYEAVLDTPRITERDGRPVQVRASYFTLAPVPVAFEEFRDWWRAYRSFHRLVRDPVFRVDLRLEAGDALIYDNHRMLHARTGFVGARWVRGVYLEPAS